VKTDKEKISADGKIPSALVLAYVAFGRFKKQNRLSSIVWVTKLNAHA